VSALPITNTNCRTTEHSTSNSLLATFLGFRKPLYSCTEAMCHSSHPSTSLLVISFTRPSPTLVLQVTNTGARRPGYKAKWALVSVLLAQSAHTSNVAIQVCSSIHRMRVRPRVWFKRVSLPYQWVAPVTRSVVATEYTQTSDYMVCWKIKPTIIIHWDAVRLIKGSFVYIVCRLSIYIKNVKDK